MERPKSYFENDGKLSKITEDGMRINFYPEPSGIVITQLPGVPHSDYKDDLNKNFKDMTQDQMSDYSFSFFNKK